MISAPAELSTEIRRGHVALACHTPLFLTRDEAAIGSSMDGPGAQMRLQLLSRFPLRPQQSPVADSPPVGAHQALSHPQNASDPCVCGGLRGLCPQHPHWTLKLGLLREGRWMGNLCWQGSVPAEECKTRLDSSLRLLWFASQRFPLR